MFWKEKEPQEETVRERHWALEIHYESGAKIEWNLFPPPTEEQQKEFWEAFRLSEDGGFIVWRNAAFKAKGILHLWLGEKA